MNAPPKWDLGKYLPLLRLLARRLELNPRLQAKIDDSDVVGETMLRACANLDQCKAQTEAELIAWLQTILTNAFIDIVRKYRRPGCNVGLEQSIEKSSGRLHEILAGPQSSPSEQAMRKETLLKLAEGMEQLLDDERDVVIQRKLLGMKLRDIANQLPPTKNRRRRTKKAVAGLLARGLQKLRVYLKDSE